MTTVNDALTVFVAARLDEDEAIAKGAIASPWTCEVLNRGTGKQEWVVVGHLHEFAVLSGEVGIGWMAGLPHDGEHIARHDPARVLREVEAKRKILAAYDAAVARQAAAADGRADEEPDWHVARRMALHFACSALSAAWSDHADYGRGWTPAT